MEAKHDPWQTLRGLFPKWDPTPEETSLFRKQFGSRSREVMVTAIENFRIGYRYTQPNLGSILKEYSVIMNNRNSAADKVASQSEVDDAEFVRKVESDNAKILFDLELLTDEQLADLREGMKKAPGVSMISGKMTGSPDGWSRVTRGLSWVLAEKMGLIAGSSSSGQPQGPSPGRE